MIHTPSVFFFNDTATTEIYTLSLHDALPILRFQELLSIGSRVFYETHLAPLLRMQGMVREVALDVVRADGSLLPCLLNAVEVRDDKGAPLLVRATVFEATSRRRYEKALLAAQRAAAEDRKSTRLNS